MNKFVKLCANVFVAECDEKYEKGDIITIQTKYGKDVECEVYNLLKEKDGKFYYSIVRCDEQSYAERKKQQWQNRIDRAEAKSNEYFEKAQENRDFLSLGEPIKVGHSSEKRHRALIERNNKRMDKCLKYSQMASDMESKFRYWENKAKEITLAMPESLEYFEYKLEEAKELQRQYKSKEREQEHAYSLTYATKAVKELTQKLETAKKLWG